MISGSDCDHLHHLVPGALVSQIPEAVDEALAGLAVDPARLQHGLALFHELENRDKQHHSHPSSWGLKRETLEVVTSVINLTERAVEQN